MFKTIRQSWGSYIRSAARFSQRHRLSSDNQNAVTRLIIVLLNSCRPSTISRLVAFCIVDAIERQGQRRRAWTNIAQKHLKRFPPSFAYRHMHVGRMRQFKPFSATSFHPSPSSIFLRHHSADTFSMLHGICSSQTSTTLRMPTPKFADINGSLQSALATAQPSTVCLSGDGSQAAELLSAEFQSWWHAAILTQNNGTTAMVVHGS